ncbi:MAG TPA: T9SS type A sorting domain-containing protein [bacterium]|nr:T9SS type A sorting domain-containing protein [bacterium]
MKYLLVSTMFVLLLLATVAFADRVIEPTEGFVNEIIAADTSAGKVRNNTTYIFRRGATYFANYRIENVGWVMTLKAEDGTGPKPIIRVWPDGTGAVQQVIYGRDDVYVYNLVLDGMGPDLNTSEPDPFFKMNGQLIRADAPGKVFVLDGCIINNAAQVLLRSSSGNRKIQLTNCIMANAGQLSSNDPGNGRCFDFRDAVTDSLILRNCTFVNGIDRIIRHRDANKKNNMLGYVEIDHCTVVNWLGTFGVFMLGDLGTKLKMTNNLLYNPMILGWDTNDPWRILEFELPGEFDENGHGKMTMLNDEPNDNINPVFEVHHNVVCWEPEVTQYWQQVNVAKPLFATERILSKLDAGLGAPYVEASVQLANIPKNGLDIVKWYHNTGDPAKPYQGAVTTADVDLDRRTNQYWDQEFNCAYTTDNIAFTGSDGKPVGAGTWNSTAPALKQRIIEPTEGFVNEIIAADTTAGKGRNNTTYVFRRGATYFTNYRIENVGWVMTLKAEDGTGPKPIIRVWPDGTGAVQQVIYGRDDVYVYNLVLDGMGPDLNTSEPDPFFKMNGQLIRADAPGKVFVLDGCIINNAAQVLLRSSSGNRKIQLTNCIMANAGQLSSNDPGNGRCFDFRDAVTDSLILRNCTFVNGIDRIIRHRDANKKNNMLGYVEIDHCTVVNWLGTFGVFMLGDLGTKLKMTNNLLYNPMILGWDTNDPWRILEFELPGEFDENGHGKMTMLNDEPNDNINPVFEVHHNVVCWEPEVTQYWQQVNVAKPLFATERILSKLDAGLGAPYVEASVQLANIPKNGLDIVKWYHNTGDPAKPYQGAVTTADVDLDRRTNQYWDQEFNCAYTTDNIAFIGSDRKPVGDTNWMSKLTAVEHRRTVTPTAFELEQNFPNPFNPATKINYTIDKPGRVMLKMYNVLGKEMATLVDEVQSAGAYSVTWDASTLPSGVYIYTLQSGSQIMSKKLLLMK